ncbi:MAG: hypothetical protein ACRCY4_09610 [Brevinema sp.]
MTNNNQFYTHLQTVGDTYVKIFSENLGKNKKRNLVYAQGALRVTRDGLEIARNIKFKHPQETVIHNFILQNTHGLNDNSTSYFLTVGWVLKNYRDWDTIREKLTRVQLSDPIFTKEARVEAIRNSIKIDLFPEFEHCIQEICTQCDKIPSEILEIEDINRSLWIETLNVMSSSKDTISIHLNPNVQYFPRNSLLAFDERIAKNDADDLKLLYNVQDHKVLIKKQIDPLLIEVSSKTAPIPAAKRKQIAEAYINATNSYDQKKDVVLWQSWKNRAARLSGLYAVIIARGLFSNEKLMLLQDGLATAIECLKHGATDSLSGAFDKAGIPILKNIIGADFRSDYKEGYSSASMTIKLVWNVCSYFLDSVFVEESWSE